MNEAPTSLASALDAVLPTGETKRFGELSLSRDPSGAFLAMHVEDATAGTSPERLVPIDTAAALREWAKFDAAGEYRPLKTAPGLKTGWVSRSEDAAAFLKLLDAVYPGAFAGWVAYSRGEFDATPLRETLGRQTGMYRFAGTITDAMANRIMRETCSPGCLRTIAWPIDDSCAVGRIKAAKGTVPLICLEACTFAVNEARRLAKEAFEGTTAE